jgi:hypothetical protein
MKTAYAILMKYAGIGMVVVGILAILLSPFCVIGRAHEKKGAYIEGLFLFSLF